MPDLYHYTDPRGRRSGPFTEQELKNLAARGLLEAEGRIELSGLGVPWSVAEVDWLRDAFPLGSGAPDERASGTGEVARPPAPPDAVGATGPARDEATVAVPPPPAALTAQRDAGGDTGADGRTGATDGIGAATGADPRAEAPARTPELPFAFRPATVEPPSAAAPSTADAPLARSTYVLLAILPALVGVFGVHNVLAGFTGRGIAQLVLSIFTLGGLAGGFAFPPTCCCFGAPMYLGLLVWVVLEAVTQATDARGRAMG
ncbi:MAG: hypothetical protein RI967_2417 [Planctomycetota bacterium]